MTGFGDAGALLNLPGVTSNVALQLGQLAPAQLQAIASQLQTAAATAAPAISLAETVGSGQQPSSIEIVGALAAVATVAAGPVAGAAIGAVGAGVLAFEAGLQGLFTALGLYYHPPEYNYLGLLRQGIDPIPYGLSDPVAIDVSTFEKLYSFIPNGDSHHPPISGNVDENMLSLFFNAYLQRMTRSELQDAYGPTADISGLYTTRTDFESFFYLMLLQSMNLWANALPFVQPQALLESAASIWNAQHSSSSVVTFHPAQDAKGSTPLIDSILGPIGDIPNHIQDSPPLTINTGEYLATDEMTKVIRLHLEQAPVSSASTSASSTSMSTGSKVAISTAVVVGSAAVGLGVWAFVTHQTVGEAWSRVWKKSGGKLLRKGR